MSPATSEVLLDLSQPRSITLYDRGRSYTLHCRRITDQDWTAYFNGITVSSQQEGRERINVVDVTTPRVALAEALLTGAEGYSVAGGSEITSLENWQTRIPFAHRVKLGETLADCRPSKDVELTIYPEGEVVLLDATWGLVDGKMLKFTELKHIFNTPTEAQHRRYLREASRSTIVGGSRSGKTLYRGAQLLLAKLYDELIVKAEGYAFEGEPFTANTQVIAGMDMLHKVMAAQELFQPQDTASVAEGDDE
jgi:hypothetical protein